MDVMKALQPAGELYKTGEFLQALGLVEELWQSIPEPKVAVGNAYNIIEYAVALCMKLNRLDDAWAWASHGPQFNETRKDIGESEFLLGKVAYERGDLVTAKANFQVAKEKSKGRIFQGEDPKYKALLKG